jgi:DNA mismatch repair protein MutS
VIGDEVCRGTEQISANAIVATTVIHLSKCGANFIFATHLHDVANMERIKVLSNVKVFHLTVEYDKIKDTLVFDRKLKSGPGEPIYGITVAKYIINDSEFIKMAQEIKNEILDVPNKILNSKQSKYNAKVFVHECAVCKKTSNGDEINTGMFDTHHIEHQENCKDGFSIDKPHLPMNNESNLVVLCKECHYKVHHDELQIFGYTDTINGPVLKFTNVLVTPIKKKIVKRKI